MPEGKSLTALLLSIAWKQNVLLVFNVLSSLERQKPSATLISVAGASFSINNENCFLSMKPAILFLNNSAVAGFSISASIFC